MNSHYFSASPDTPARERRITVTLGGADREVVTAGGVFSPEQLDRGTAVLLRTVDAPPASGDILDLGCGWGPIALDAAIAAPGARVWAVDVNARSRELTERNAAALGLSNVVVADPDEVPETVRFSEIRSNPPIRIGKAQLHAILERWLPRLLPGGVAYLVVAKHLGADSLRAWLTERFAATHEVDRRARDRGFHVLEVLAEE